MELDRRYHSTIHLILEPMVSKVQLQDVGRFSVFSGTNYFEQENPVKMMHVTLLQNMITRRKVPRN